MPRKKRGGKAAANARKAKAAKIAQAQQAQNIITEETVSTVTQSLFESEVQSEESCSSGTPKSCNTPIEIDKTVINSATSVQHKKFGKFRCLLLDEAIKNDISSSESEVLSEIQMETLEVDNNIEIITIDPENLIEDFKSVEISNAETIVQDDIPLYSDDMQVVHEEIAEDITENVIEIDTSQMSTENVISYIIETEASIEPEATIIPETEEKIEFVGTLQSDESQEQCIILTVQESTLQETSSNDELNSEEPEIKEEEVKLDEIEIKLQEMDELEPKKENNESASEQVVLSLDKKEQDTESSNSNNEESTTAVRRSSRIKSISVLKQRSKGRGLVKSDKLDKKEKYKPSKNMSSDLEIISENSNSNTASEKNSSRSDSPSFATPTIGLDSDLKPVKVKSRWRRSSELEMGGTSPLTIAPYPLLSPNLVSEISDTQSQTHKDESPPSIYDEEMENRLRQFQSLSENQYLTERTTCKEAKKMVCDCFLTKEEIKNGEFGCGEDCLNRLLMIECGSQCVVVDRCTNKRFQKMQYAPCEVFRTEKKGFGIRATADVPYGEFLLEYVGEVLDPDEFDNRAKEYSKDKNRHYYFMALRADAVIDATQKGNISRFINHSCDPNAETQKWTVNGELRIGFFSKRSILAGEEITFDYQFQRYGKEAQKCYCEASNCRGWIGEEPDDEEDEESCEEREDEIEEEHKESGSPETDVQEPMKVEKPVRRRRLIKKQRKDIFEDLDLDEEIGMLSTTGVKNQAHTLKLSRLMVRAKDVGPRMQLLRFLREGELPCRRLFLDYHGLRLIHGWMTDAVSMINEENTNYDFKIELLQTLASLPIPNKTLLQDSKVLSTVEKWSRITKPEMISPTDGDSASNSPQIDAVTNAESIKKESDKAEELLKVEELPKPELLNPEKLLKHEESLKPEGLPNSNLEESTKPHDEPMEIDIVIENRITKSIKLSDFEDFSADIQIDLSKSDIKYHQVKQIIAEENVIKEDVFDNKMEQKENLDIAAEIKIKEEADNENKGKQEEIPESFEKMEEIPIENESKTIISKLTTKLLIDWTILKEVFRIPKKERIEQMKEHEREANRDYKAGLGFEQETSSKRYSWERYRIIEKERRKSKEAEYDRIDRSISKKGIRLDDRNIVHIPKLSKHERRQLFALQVAQEEEGRRRKQEQEMWRMHEQRCMVMASDPRLTNIEMNQNYQWSWNPQTGQWQSFPPGAVIPQGSGMPPVSGQGMPGPGMPPGQGMPPGPGAPPGMPPGPGLPQGMSSGPGMSAAPGVSINQQPMFPNAPPPHMQMMISPLPGNPLVTANRPPLIQPQTFQPPPVATEEKVMFAGPIPPPVKLPSKWKCAKDKYGRPYYYHIKIRISQWIPPEFLLPTEESTTELCDETSSSSESSSLSSDSSSDSEDASELDDTKLLLEIRNKLNLKQIEAKEDILSPIVTMDVAADSPKFEKVEILQPVVEIPKRKRVGLVQEIIISPRHEEDKQQFKSDYKKYKDNKEKVRRDKQLILEQTKKKLKSKSTKTSSSKMSSKTSRKHRLSKSAKLKSVSSIDMNSEEARKIKEIFRSTMASVMVQNLNAFRKPDCKHARITNTEDFKHLARKLTHFVMLKELKHCQNIEDLTCNESVKSKAKDFVKKYMAKFGDVYSRPKDDSID